MVTTLLSYPLSRDAFASKNSKDCLETCNFVEVAYKLLKNFNFCRGFIDCQQQWTTEQRVSHQMMRTALKKTAIVKQISLM